MNNNVKTTKIDIEVSLISAISKSGNPYKYLELKNEQFEKRVFLEPNELRLLELITELNKSKSSFFDDEDDEE